MLLTLPGDRSRRCRCRSGKPTAADTDPLSLSLLGVCDRLLPLPLPEPLPVPLLQVLRPPLLLPAAAPGA